MRERDAHNKEVSGPLSDVFRTRRLILERVNDVEFYAKSLARMAVDNKQEAQFIDWEEVNRLISRAVDLVRIGVPYDVCDCKAKELDCPKCQGRKWRTARYSHEALIQAQQLSSLASSKNSQS